jgi:phage FluMu protein Com
MTELIDQIFLGNKFVQDANKDYIKIDNVSFGKLAKYSYKAIKSDDIGKLLEDCVQDTDVTLIIYDWNKKIGYIKKGFELANNIDSSVKENTTTYIVKSRISKDNLAYFGKPPLEPKPTPTDPPMINGFIKLNKGKLELNGRSFVPVGWNAFFLGFMQETMKYPTKAQVTEIFEAARMLKVTMIRSHTLGFSAENESTLIDKSNKFNDKAWDIIDFAYAEAKRCSVKLIIVLCDPYEYYHGSVKTFCKPSGVSKNEFFTHPAPRAEFKKYVKEYLNHTNKYTNVAVKDALEVGFLELGNELGNYRPNSGSTAVPTKDWIQDITRYIKSIDKNHLVLNGSDECLGSKESDDFSIPEIDVYQSHFYSWEVKRIKNDAKRSMDVGRPYIVGESDSKYETNWYKTIEAIPNMCGSMTWAIYPHENGKPDGKRIMHNDGFIFWCDNQSNENTKNLLTMTNHFRRMQNLPELKKINF